MSRPTRDGTTAKPVSRYEILRRDDRGQGGVHFSLCSADHEQDWRFYAVDPYYCYNMCDHTYMHIHIMHHAYYIIHNTSLNNVRNNKQQHNNNIIHTFIYIYI